MRIQAHTHWLPKRGNTLAEYEDAFCPKSAPEGLSHCYRFAVSDGASESMLSGPWAEVLVKSFCRCEVALTRATAKAIVGRAYMAYEAWLKEYLRRRERDGKPIQWYEEPGLEAGAFATLLGLTLHSPSIGSRAEGGKWEAICLGDTCLFHVRGGNLITSFAIKKSSEFGQRPVLISSNPAKNRLSVGKIKITSGSWRRGDRFYLMTDALSAWFLKEREQGNVPWETLDDAGFDELVPSLRSEGVMRNDDVTLTSIRVV